MSKYADRLIEHINRPLLFKLLRALTATVIADPRNVVRKRVQPYIHHMLIIKIHRDPPLERWLLQGDGKMSKSKGNVLYADELVEFFGVDAVRYFVLHEMPFDNDGVVQPYIHHMLIIKIHRDPPLERSPGHAQILQPRKKEVIHHLVNKYFGGIVMDKGAVDAVDADLKAVVEGTPGAVDTKMNDLRVADAFDFSHHFFNVQPLEQDLGLLRHFAVPDLA